MQRALLADGTAFRGGRDVRRVGVGWSGHARGAKQGAAVIESGVAVVVAEGAGVPNAHEARREHVEQKASQEFLGGQRHDLLPILIGVVLPAEADDPVDEVDEAGVGDRDAMGIASEVGEHTVGSAKRRLGIHHPGLDVERVQEAAPGDGYA